MNIYEVNLVPDHPLNDTYDYFDGFVVVAPSGTIARRLASRYPYTADSIVRGPEFLDTTQSTCKKIGVASSREKEGVRLASFNAG